MGIRRMGTLAGSRTAGSRTEVRPAGAWAVLPTSDGPTPVPVSPRPERDAGTIGRVEQATAGPVRRAVTATMDLDLSNT